MKEKIKAGAFGLLIIFLSLTACRSLAQSDNSSKNDNQLKTEIQLQNTTSITPVVIASPTTIIKSENPFADLPAELMTKGDLQAKNSDKCQLFSSEAKEKHKNKTRSYQIKFASGEKSVIIEDYAANREIVNYKGEQLRPYINENLINKYILSATSGQTMTLQVSPAQRKAVRDDARLDVGGLYLEIAVLEDCKNVETLPLAWKTDKEVREKFRFKLPKTGDYSILVASGAFEETGYRLKVTIE